MRRPLQAFSALEFTPMTSSHTTRPEAPRVFQIAVLVALLCGGLDVALAILNRAHSFENLMLIFPSMYATAVLVALLFLGAWWMVLRPMAPCRTRSPWRWR